MNYFHINNTPFNYDFEFENLNKTNNWKSECTLLDYLEANDFNIPHYCYQKGLSIAGNCRMCLIEVEQATKPVISCATTAKSCLKADYVFTDSPLVKKTRENILEFLLINHPLDCPICDQGGECDLQDQSLYYGLTRKRFYNFKRIVSDKNISPIVKTIMTRCIHCTRCVRFAKEVAGMRNLGLLGRGTYSEIGTFVSKMLDSELSGNIVDICPVGALTQKFSSYVHRSWELKVKKSIDFTDSSGTDLLFYTKNNKIVRALPNTRFKLKGKENSTENDSNNNNNFYITWINDKTRYCFTGDGILESSISSFISYFYSNKNREFMQELSWDELIKNLVYTVYLQEHLRAHNTFFKKKLIIVLDASIDIETLLLVKVLEQKFPFIEIKKNENTNYFNNDLETNYLLNLSSSDLEKSTSCILLNTNPRYENSEVNLKLKKRYLQGNFEIFSINPNLNLTYATTKLGYSSKFLIKLIEGNTSICKKILTKQNPILLTSSIILRRKDSYNNIPKLFKQINYFMKSKFKVSILNTRLNESGINETFSTKVIERKDLKNNDVIFLNPNLKFSIFSKFLYFRLLSKHAYLNNESNFIMDHSLENNYYEYKKIFDIKNYFYLPNKSFFETSGTFLDSQGVFKTSSKLVYNNKFSKSTWNFIRKLTNNLTNVNYLHADNTSNKLIFLKNIFNNYLAFKKFVVYNYLALIDFEVLVDNLKICNYKTLYNTFFLNSKTKFFPLIKSVSQAPFKLWINDFFTGGKNLMVEKSYLFMKCSKNMKNLDNNFLKKITS